MKIATSIGALLLLASCAINTAVGPTAMKPSFIARGVDSGARQVLDNYYSVNPDCGNEGYPEIKVLQNPTHGIVAVENGDTYPSFAKDNVRYECNKQKVASTQLFYQSSAGYQGKDSFTIQVRFVTSSLKQYTYNVDVL